MRHKVKQFKVSAEEALVKLRHWCAYQERSQHEARQKLLLMGLATGEAESVVSALIQENFLNEERFAKAYAGGKFRIKGWGCKKILAGLKAHRLSPKCIQIGLKEIDGDEYSAQIKKLLTKKLGENLSGSQVQKAVAQLLSKGYEFDKIKNQLAFISENAASHAIEPDEETINFSLGLQLE
jgi:regulatory protein